MQENNNRDWFNEHKPRYQTAHADVVAFAETLLDKMSHHDELVQMTGKKSIFRIYRDVRFSKNKLPYKTHFGGSYHRKKPELRGGYYMHIAPNDASFIATGFWEPNKDDLLRIRKEFEMDDSEIRAILNNKSFKSVWGDLVGDEVKTAPKGFSKEHKNIDLIRKKQFIFTKKYTDKEVLSRDHMKVRIHFLALVQSK